MFSRVVRRDIKPKANPARSRTLNCDAGAEACGTLRVSVLLNTNGFRWPILMIGSHDDSEITFYEELGVAPNASPEEIRDAFRLFVRLLHPDQQTDPQLKEIAEKEMRKLNRIHAVLSDPERRRRYDQRLNDDLFSRQRFLADNHRLPPRGGKSGRRENLPPSRRGSRGSDSLGGV